MGNRVYGARRVLTIDVPEPGIVRLTVTSGRTVLAVRDIPYRGSVDNHLLTAVDNLFNERILDKFVPLSVRTGSGIDSKSILYRIVITLGAALQAARPAV